MWTIHHQNPDPRLHFPEIIRPIVPSCTGSPRSIGTTRCIGSTHYIGTPCYTDTPRQTGSHPNTTMGTKSAHLRIVLRSEVSASLPLRTCPHAIRPNTLRPTHDGRGHEVKEGETSSQIWNRHLSSLALLEPFAISRRAWRQCNRVRRRVRKPRGGSCLNVQFNLGHPSRGIRRQ